MFGIGCRARTLLPFFLASAAAGPAALRAQDAMHRAAPTLDVHASSAREGAALQPSDVVRIEVWRRPELSGDFTVGLDGALRHPVFRDIVVAGLPMTEVESRVRSVLLRFDATPVFIVEPLFRVSVEGEVRQPNLYALARETTFSQAIALAGGITPLGRADRVSVIRAGTVLRLDLNDAAATPASSRIASGDRIIVGARRNVLRDNIAPIASIAAALGTVVAIATRNR